MPKLNTTKKSLWDALKGPAYWGLIPDFAFALSSEQENASPNFQADFIRLFGFKLQSLTQGALGQHGPLIKALEKHLSSKKSRNTPLYPQLVCLNKLLS